MTKDLTAIPAYCPARSPKRYSAVVTSPTAISVTDVAATIRNDNSVYAKSTSMTVLLLIAFFLSISLTPFRMP